MIITEAFLTVLLNIFHQTKKKSIAKYLLFGQLHFSISVCMWLMPELWNAFGLWKFP